VCFNEVIIKDTRLVLTKDPSMLKLVNLFGEISNMYCSFNYVSTYLLFMALYRQLKSKCEVYWLLLVLCLNCVPKSLDFEVTVSTPLAKTMVAESICKSCVIKIGGNELLADLIFLQIQEFDVILGMDWLALSNLPC